MYIRKVHIFDNKCDPGQCNHECVQPQQGEKVFWIDPAINKARVKNNADLTKAEQEIEAGYAIEHCPREAIWGRGEGEPLGNRH